MNFLNTTNTIPSPSTGLLIMGVIELIAAIILFVLIPVHVNFMKKKGILKGKITSVSFLAIVMGTLASLLVTLSLEVFQNVANYFLYIALGFVLIGLGLCTFLIIQKKTQPKQWLSNWTTSVKPYLVYFIIEFIVLIIQISLVASHNIELIKASNIFGTIAICSDIMLAMSVFTSLYKVTRRA